MTETNATQEKLANQFASFDPEALKKTFDDLNATIHKVAKPVSEDLSALKTGLDALLPLLDEMQSLLSQRGDRREAFDAAGLPTWTEWFRKFKVDTGLNVTLRAVQKQLAKLRGAKPKKKPEPPVKLSARDQRRLLSAQQFANELVNAIEHGADYSESLREYKRVAMGADTIAELLDNAAAQSETTIATDSGAEVQVGVASALVPSAPSSTTPSSVIPMPQPMPLPRAGAWIDLANSVVSACREHLAATFEGLEPRDATEVFGKFMQRVAQTCCRYYDGAALEMQIAVEYVGPKPPKMCQPIHSEAERCRRVTALEFDTPE